MIVRDQETPDDDAVHEVIALAFGQPDEAKLVRALRRNSKDVITLVAEDAGQIVGHVLLSPVTLEPPAGEWPALGLAPVAVRPERQREGIGQRLVRVAVDRAQAAGHSVMVVLGDPAYYHRFGFRRARDFGLKNHYGADEAFMAIELAPGGLTECHGTVVYQPEFDEASC